jgi:Tol biopolymer transport system component/predicted Ser/Thr protein kinase
VKEVFDAALEYAPGERSGFLGQACADDDFLRGEVNSLLSCYEQETGFMETPAGALAAQFLAKEESVALIGQQISHYQIMREIGRGGMGVVYLAEDINLGRRSVALKLLPAHLTTDPDRLRRFEQEARAASALNHPNILTIHEIGQRDGRPFIATEFIDGKTLREQMRNQELKLSEALNIAAQIASALIAAHKAGIVHRDIKPENIMIRGDGYVKVLDFGLAKLMEQPFAAVDTEAATREMVKTNPGAVMGTAGYMSPEQARGLAVDARTDIWSLGVVLYEIVTKRVPFKGETPSHVIVSILEQEPPPLTDYLPEAPVRLQEIISKALCKNREGRYQSINDLLMDLKSLRQELGPDAENGPVKRLKAASGRASERTAENVFSVSRLSLLAAVLALVMGAGLWLYRPRHNAAPSLPPMKVVPFTSFPGSEFDPVFSPDGNQIAFAWGGEQDGNWQIYVKQIGSEKPLRITSIPDPAWAWAPTWSPDGQRIAFVRISESERAIYTVATLGTESERMLEPLAPKEGWGGYFPSKIDWSPDGKFIATTDLISKQEPPRIFLVSPETGEKRMLTSPPVLGDGDYEPAFSPDSQTVAFFRRTVNTSDIYLVPVMGGEPRRLTFDDKQSTCPVWTPDGREIVFTSDRGGTSSLWRIPVSGGTPERLPVGGDNVGRSSISRKGHRLAYVQTTPQSVNINRIEVPGTTGHNNSPKTLVASTRAQFSPQFSPDGKSIAFGSHRSGSAEIWMCDSEGRNPIQLTSFNGPEAGTPRWSPDGKRLAFDSRAKGDLDIYLLSVEGGPPRRITSESSEDHLPSWSQDGRWIYFASNRSGNYQVWKVPVEGGEAVQVTKQGGLLAFESADGKFVYYSKGLLIPGVWRVPVAGGEETLAFNLKEADLGKWALVDDGIYFIDGDEKEGVAVEFLSFATHQITQVAGLGKIRVYAHGFAASRDHRWILYTQAIPADRDIMLVENFR